MQGLAGSTSRRHGRRSTITPLFTALLTATAMAVPAVAQADESAAGPSEADNQQQTEQAPQVDPNDPDGAWPGYSVGSDGSRSQEQRAGPGGPGGIDVSGHQGSVDWSKAWDHGARFAIVKATEGVGFRSDAFRHQYDGSYEVGMTRGAYHFALPDASTGAAQANFFVDNGGAWTPDGRTLPGALDIEHNPYGETCYGMDPASMSRWIADFSNTYHDRTGRFPMIYTTASWWNQCTGGNPDFGENNPLWVARYNSKVGELPAGWQTHTIWQHSNGAPPLPGCRDAFNGTNAQLRQFAA